MGDAVLCSSTGISDQASSIPSGLQTALKKTFWLRPLPSRNGCSRFSWAYTSARLSAIRARSSVFARRSVDSRCRMAFLPSGSTLRVP
jgi:hypothetical protein